MIYKEGTRIQKCNSKYGDTHQDGDKGTIISVVEIPQSTRNEIANNNHLMGLAPPGYSPEAAYFVEWDDLPGVPVAVTEFKIKPVES